MSEPASPKPPGTDVIVLETEISALSDEAGGATITPIPDRRRIDSDVRAFLRAPSTPWIVFDREGRPPSQLAVGEVFPAAYSSVISDQGFFPATAAIDAIAAHAKVEPSSLAVASDLASGVSEEVPDFVASPILVLGLSRRVIGAAAVAVAIVSMLAVGASAFHAADASQPTASSPNTMTQSLAAHEHPRGASPVPADLAPPDLAPAVDRHEPRDRAPVVAAPPADPASSPASTSPESPAKAAAKKYARFTVAGEARSRDVFMDGKRMLGKGARSFTVLCGTHTVAIGERANTREVDIPCTGTAELVISK